MIDSQLKPCGVVSPRVSAAFFAVPREAFVAAGRRGLAYVDAPQPLKPGRELLAPLSLGLLVEHAEIQPNDKVLIVGTGSGYSAAIVSQLSNSVVALESDSELAAEARDNLAAYAEVRVVEGPLEKGWAEAAPYSLILIDGAVEELPVELIAQLAEGGRLLAIVVGSDGVSRAAKGIRRAGLLPLEPFAEAPGAVLPSFGKAPAFQF
nr:protein-L-isoaspartate O-methyltransferase [Sandaracinobacteroides sayramensis]